MKNIIKTRTLFGAGLTALAFSSVFTSTAFAQTCAAVPTCEELGYDLSASDCTGKKALKCPFDNTKFYCPDGSGNNGSCDNPNVGDILYSDKTCNTNVVSGKTPIGVIFDGERRRAIALATERARWSIHDFDIPSLTNFEENSADYSDWNGKNNTNIILTYCQTNSQSCPAVEYVNSYVTEGTNAGDWYLPAAAEVHKFIGLRNTLNTVLKKINGTEIPDDWHWTSNEHSADQALDHYPNDAYAFVMTKYDDDYVRPVLAF